MQKLYKINITIFNDFGELVDTQFAFNSLDGLSNEMGEKMFELGQQAKKFAEENNMLTEEMYDSKEEAEFNKEDLI